MPELYEHQQTSIEQLLAGKHIIVAGVGCLAKGTPIPMANGEIKLVEELKDGDEIIAYDEDTEKLVANKISRVFRTSHKPKPMIKLRYGGEEITTTYDHPFFNGEGYYPLYQLVWRTLETSQRVQLKLLCKQYGQTFNDKAIRCKHCCSNETWQGQNWTLEDADGRTDSKSTSYRSRELAGEPQKIAFCEPYKLRPDGQSSEQPRMVHPEVQFLVGNKMWGCRIPYMARQEWAETNCGRASKTTSVLSGKCCPVQVELGEEESDRHSCEHLSKNSKGDNIRSDAWEEITIETARPYYSICMREAPYTYCVGREHYFMTHNTGKTAIALIWAAKKCEETGKNKILVITTASKSRTGDFETEDKIWNGSNGRELVVISWHKLAKWVGEHWESLSEWVVIGDEIQRSKGYTTGMGKAFLKIAKKTPDWAGFTGTPGDSWEAFITYFVATNQVRNKTSFMAQYANVQTYKGYPEIVGWRNEDQLATMWKRISYAPDARKALSELPKENYRTITFSKPAAYARVLKTRQNAEGEFLDTSGALVAELRRTCFTKDKQQWVSDFVQDSDSGAVIFYNYVSTGDKLAEICEKALGKSGRVWRIDGKHHEIPTAETIGKKDMVLCQWQSGSEALNLQYLHLWIGVELCYSNSMLHQSMGRIKRIGQEHPMWFFRLVTEKTIEQDIVKTLAEKKEFSERNWCISNNLIQEDDGN